MAYLHRTLPSTKVVFFYSSRIRTLVAMATYSFNRLIMEKVEIGNFYCLIGDNRISFLQKCLLNSYVSPLEGSGDILFFPLRLWVCLSVCPSQNRVRSIT